MAASSSSRLTTTEASTDVRSKIVCMFLLNGSCRNGSSCLYSHDLSKTDRSSSICQYFLMGTCVYGDHCFYRHANANESTTSTRSNPVSSAATAATSTRRHQTVVSGDNLDADDEAPMSAAAQKELVTRLHSNNKQTQLKTFTYSADSSGASSVTNSSVNSSVNSPPSAVTPDNTSGERPAPTSYFEALTGAKARAFAASHSGTEEELSIFDPNYMAHLKQQLQQQQQQRSHAAANAAKDDSALHSQLCPYFEKSLECPFGEQCGYTHGDVCEICNTACLHPGDERQRAEHKRGCLQLIEQDMEEAFAVQRSAEKACGICMEIVWEKESLGDKRFGILENCNHVFCLPCIMKWRASKTYENKIVKACPECRVKSDYVTPSAFWFEDEQNKKKIIEEYKNKLRKTPCKHFKQGEGQCPFGNKCFYLHMNKDGSLADLPEPSRRRRYNRYGDLEAFSSFVNVDFDFSDDENDELDLVEFFRQNLLIEMDSDLDLFEVYDPFL